jgi:hypothetical protein
MRLLHGNSGPGYGMFSIGLGTDIPRVITLSKGVLFRRSNFIFS